MKTLVHNYKAIPVMKKMFFTCLILIQSILSFGQTIIKMTPSNGVFLIPCKINGLALNFIFDTGASDVSISLTEAIFMLKNGYLLSGDILGEASYRVANGDITSGTKIILREIIIGDKKLKNIEASVVHNLDAPLLLGQSALSKLGQYSFDYVTNTLSIKNNQDSLDNNIDFTNKKLTERNFYDLAKAAFDAKDYYKTISISKKYIEAYPDKPQGYSFNAAAAKAIDTDTTIGSAVTPIQQYNQFLQKDPIKNKKTLYNNDYYLLIFYAEKVKDIPKAIEICNDMMRLYPDSSEENDFARRTQKDLKKILK